MDKSLVYSVGAELDETFDHIESLGVAQTCPQSEMSQILLTKLAKWNIAKNLSVVPVRFKEYPCLSSHSK